MGLALGALACARRDRWLAAGVLVGLAYLTQQYAVLVAVPLFVLAPSVKRLRYTSAAVATVALVAVPLATMVSVRLQDVLIGTGNSDVVGGTLVWELGLHGTPRLMIARLLPIVLSLSLSYWVVKRLGPSAMDPVPLTALIALSLGLRLVFEYNLFPYYFMALTVALVLLEVARGHFRYSVFVWLAGLSVLLVPDRFFVPSWSGGIYDVLPLLGILLGLGLVAVPRLRGRPRWGTVLGVFLLLGVLLDWRIGGGSFRGQVPTWLWQISFVGSGMALAAAPLWARVHEQIPELVSAASA